jgi:hypothetical protein
MDAFPSNSNQRKPQTEKPSEPEKTVKQVVASEDVIRRKQPMSKRLRASLLGGDEQSVKDYVILGVLVPAIKDMIADAITGGVERMIFGEDLRPGRRGARHGGGAARFDYAGISKGPIQQPRGREDARGPQLSRRARAMHDFDEIVLPSRSVAESVLTEMFDHLDRFEVVTVADFYEMVGYSGAFTDRKYGWTDLRGTRPVRTKGGGWVLDLPPTEAID